MFLLLTALACQTCPEGQSCQAPCPVPAPEEGKTPAAAATLATVDEYMQSDFWADSSGMGPGGGGATETHDGIYIVMPRRSTDGFQSTGFLIARDGVSAPPTSIAPATGNEETFCASRTFSWPQFLGGGANPGVVSWTILPVTDAEPAQGKCNGAPVRLDGTFDPANPATEYPLDTSPTKAGVKRAWVKACTPGATCPAAADGVPDTSGARATILMPGVYDLKSMGVTAPAAGGADVTVSGTGTLYVRPTNVAGKPWTVETYCYDANFRWPRVNSPFVPNGGLGTFRDAHFTVTPKVAAAGMPATAPAAPTCTGTQTQRADYCFTTDAAQPCVP